MTIICGEDADGFQCDEGRPCRNCVRHDVKCSLVLSPFAPQPPAVTESPRPAQETASTATPGSVGEASSSSHPGSRRVRHSPQRSSLEEKVAAMQGLLAEFTAEMDAMNNQGVNGIDYGPGSNPGECGDPQHIAQADWLTV